MLRCCISLLCRCSRRADWTVRCAVSWGLRFAALGPEGFKLHEWLSASYVDDSCSYACALRA